MSLVMSASPSRVSTSPHLAEVTVPGMTPYEMALELQAEMYRQVTRSGSRAIEDILHFSPQHVTFLALWRVADTVCLIGAAARSCTREDPSCSEEMEAWLRTLEYAGLQGEFLASIPLFFAVAWKGGDRDFKR